MTMAPTRSSSEHNGPDPSHLDIFSQIIYQLVGHQKLHLWHPNPTIVPHQELTLLFSPNKMAIMKVKAGEEVNLRLISTT